MPSALACDRCFSQKEKCVYVERTTPLSCSRCTNLGRRCATSRRKQHPGRPRKADPTSLQPRAWAEFVWAGSQVAESSALSTKRSSLALDGNLGSDCATEIEHVRRRESLLLMRPSSHLLANMTSRDILILHSMFESRLFIHKFIVGRSFADAQLQILFTSLYTSPDLLLSPFLACSGRFSTLTKTGPAGHSLEVDYKNSARAVKLLRKRMVDGGQLSDLSLDLMLSLGIVTFDLLDGGLHAHSVCRHTIRMLVRREQLAFPPSTHLPVDTVLLPLIFMDTCNCIVRRQLPVYRVQPQRLSAVDRYIGFCGPLLPHLFDICCIGHDLQEAAAAGRDRGIERRIREIDRYVRLWEPSIEGHHIANLTAEDVRVITTQAMLYKKAIALILHRLRFDFGTQDERALDLATSILADINLLYGQGWHDGEEFENDLDPPREPKQENPFEYRLGLPFLVAAVELQQPGQRSCALMTLRYVVCERMYSGINSRLKQFVRFAWHTRDSGVSKSWSDLAACELPYVLF